MNNKFLTQHMENLYKIVKEHDSEVLTGLGIAGMITSSVLAVKATPKALELLEKEKEEQNKKGLSAKEVIKSTWKCYIPAVVTGTISICCLIGARAADNRRNAVLLAAYSLSESTLKEYKNKLVDVVGEEKKEEIFKLVAQDKIDKDPVINNEVIITSGGETLCYDSLSGRYFKSDIEKIKHAVNILNKQMMDEMYVYLNDFYCEIGLSCVDIGDDLGWRIDDELIDLYFSSHITSDGTPCVVINYTNPPTYDFKKLL